jgi:hypothetical protein
MTAEPVYLDISDNAELKALAEEVRRSGRPRVLRAGGREIAVLSPAAAERPTLADPNNIWAGYDGERVRAALEASVGVGALAGVDVEKLKRDIRESRGQRERRRSTPQ